jgi:hypothetical protein
MTIEPTILKSFLGWSVESVRAAQRQAEFEQAQLERDLTCHRWKEAVNELGRELRLVAISRGQFQFDPRQPTLFKCFVMIGGELWWLEQWAADTAEGWENGRYQLTREGRPILFVGKGGVVS